MRIVLYLNDRPLLLSGIKRNAQGRIMAARVENGDWLLKLGTRTAYAFAEYGSVQTLKHEWDIASYEEIQVFDALDYDDYNAVIFAACKLRAHNKWRENINEEHPARR